MLRAMSLLALASAAAAQLGPGAGEPWETATPESQGLSSADLARVEAEVNGAMGGRVCYLVVKNGKIVHETYRGLGSETYTTAAWSATKSMCSSLFGIAKQQGWANADDLVRERNVEHGTRSCNTDAKFSHVLTMTGTSPNIEAPRFSYDTLGTTCLDALQDFIAENNPDGLTAVAWKDKYYHEVLGMEHTSWGSDVGLGCGFGADMSCRDLARAAQLWVNDGEVAGAGQVMDQRFANEGRTWVYPESGTQYGYTVWLNVNDPVDPQVAEFNGMFAQCAFASREHQTTIVSMGLGSSCGAAWTLAREYIVSADHPRYAVTRNTSSLPSAERVAFEQAVFRQEILDVRPWVVANAHTLPAKQLRTYNATLLEFGGKPLRQL